MCLVPFKGVSPQALCGLMCACTYVCMATRRLRRGLCLSEKHYLTELQTVGLLHYTPSREVLGKRISSYDDRYVHGGRVCA